MDPARRARSRERRVCEDGGVAIYVVLGAMVGFFYRFPCKKPVAVRASLLSFSMRRLVGTCGLLPCTRYIPGSCLVLVSLTRTAPRTRRNRNFPQTVRVLPSTPKALVAGCTLHRGTDGLCALDHLLAHHKGESIELLLDVVLRFASPSRLSGSTSLRRAVQVPTPPLSRAE